MFDDIRPYVDAEIPAAMQRIVADKYFPLVCEYAFQGHTVQEIAAVLGSCRTVDEFQHRFMWGAVNAIISKTTSGLTAEGVERLDPSKNYLYVSNHRDIVLDAAFFDILLDRYGRRTAEITFGANLMQGQLIIDIGKSNKMFRVERPTTVSSPRDFLVKSRYLSDYIRHTILEKKESVWIAQRNGRTKDGYDATDQGIIKMFGLSGGSDKVKALSELNIVPICISYEWEPCDVLKALELYARSSGQPYIKKPGEDLHSILTGIQQTKGRVHLTVCEPITQEDLELFRGLPSAVFNKEVASLVDSRILPAYRLYPNAYIAADMLAGKRSHSYTEAEFKAFKKHLELIKEYPAEVREILLKIYATPLLRKD
jgi:1-acyl-sn-glycerol-3-phosphate acyltransferase